MKDTATRPGSIEEYYVIRVRHGGSAGRYLGADGGFGALRRATRFASLPAAEQRLATLGAEAAATLAVEYVTRARHAASDDAGRALLARLMDIPYPYRRTAYNWLRGRDVRRLLRSQGEEVYERHRRQLREHGIDIDTRSRVILFSPPRRRIRLNTGTEAGGRDQLLPLPGQRPARDRDRD